MIVVIDNYDSFTYNIVQYLKQLKYEVTVVRNDERSLDEIEELAPTFILLSPGPGNPDESGVSLEAVDRFHMHVPILGICLGHQILAQYFGGAVRKAKKPMHGKTSRIHHDGKGIFTGLPQEYQVARYHSLVVNPESLPDCLVGTAFSEDGELMALRHINYPLESVQFHPEAIETEHGLQLLDNFLKRSALK